VYKYCQHGQAVVQMLGVDLPSRSMFARRRLGALFWQLMAKREKSYKAEPIVGTNADKAIMEAAARLMVESGTREIDVLELSKRAKVSRPTIYARYGRGQKQSVGAVIYLRILNQFLKSAGSSIQAALAVIDQTAQTTATAGEELAAILRATLSAFKHDQIFGPVVLQELTLRNPEENDLIRPIFDRVDHIIHQAQVEGHLNETPEPWKIRQILFVLTRGLLRTLYLDQYSKVDELMETSAMSEKEVEIEILKVLSSYSREQSEKKVQETIQTLGQKDGKGSERKSTK
jgi:AcrR family transcriptional regulator